MRPCLLIASSLLLSGCASLTSWFSSPPEATPASAAPEPQRPLFFNPPGSEKLSKALGITQAARTGDWVTTSAQTGFDPASGTYPEPFEAQVRLAFTHLKAALASADASLSEVVEVQTHQLDMRQFNTVIRVRREVFGRHHPTWTAIGVHALSDPNAQFQIKALAYAPR